MQRSQFIMPESITAKVEEIMSASRARFGHDAFRMEAEGESGAGESGEGEGAGEESGEAGGEGESALGDAGKKALDAMKTKWKDADKLAKDNAVALAAIQAKLDGKEAEHTAAQEKAATEKAALDKANGRIVRSEVKAAAKGVLADPADAYKFLDLDSFEVSDDGEVDDTAIEAALKALVEQKPYLAVQDGKRFQGEGDGGARKESAKSVDDQIAEAQKVGDLQTVIALKQKRAAELQAKK